MKPSANYSKLEEDGFVGVGTKITIDDVLIGKISPCVDEKFPEKDHSTVNKSTENGIVDRVVLTTNDEGFRTIKVRVRSVRIPTIGDKAGLPRASRILMIF